MMDQSDRPATDVEPNPTTEVKDDGRKPYEAPRLLKKRSVAQATLFTAKGPVSTGLTTMG